MKETFDLTILTNNTISTVLEKVEAMSVIEQDDLHFLQEHKQHLSSVLKNTYIWRTDVQKESIVCDEYCPTTHSKFHQAILEQKVQFDQSLYLAKDFEIKKLDTKKKHLEIRKIERDIQNEEDELNKQLLELDRDKMLVELQFSEYELNQAKIAMTYRMKEVKGWQQIIDRLYDQMKETGLDDEEIWNKNFGEIASMFYQSLNRFHGIEKTSDSAERANLIALAAFSVRMARDAGILESLLSKCNEIQLSSFSVIKRYLDSEPRS